MKSKKSMETETLALLIIVIVSAIVLGTALYLMIEQGKTAADIEKCRASVLLASKARTATLKQISPGLDCPISEITIDSKAKEKEKIDEEAKYMLANELKDCWSKMSANEHLQPFPEGLLQLSEQKWCLVCSDINFTEKIKKNGEIQNFVEFLQEKTIPPDNKQAYFDYLSGGGIKVNQDIASRLEENSIQDEINPAKEYMIIYSIAQEGLWERTFFLTTGTLTGAAGTAGLIFLISPEPFTKIGFIISGVILVAGLTGTTATAYTGYSFGSRWQNNIYAVNLLPKENVPELKCDYLHQQYNQK